ncbi:hypothetical protein DH2020_032226 [Rehmannia glutinosa]|uniref:Alpha/beta hydrolase fold-3 domain-containing protein n=1 Tax=Rehmannia glutinosa TaxID=99300 RepID=A0ABR0VGL9_REHGL
MAAMTIDPNLTLQINTKSQPQQRLVAEEIDGLIRVYKDGHVERPQIVPCVPPSLAPELGVTCGDTIIDTYTNIWARVYVPNANQSKHHLPLLVLAPENPLPAAYDDGVKAVNWIAHQVFVKSPQWWTSKCNASNIFLGGDSAGANIAYIVALRLRPSEIKGLVLIQPFFGGEKRTNSEKFMVQPPRSALTVAAADAYWRLSLPAGADRDHPWCNPTVKGAAAGMRDLGMLVCVSEMDILKDRNLEFCGSLKASGCRRVEAVVFKDVGHAFQILNKSPVSEIRVHELICHIKSFISRELMYSLLFEIQDLDKPSS